MKLQRYHVWGIDVCEAEKAERGAWCDAKDVEKLEAENETLKAENARLTPWLKPRATALSRFSADPVIPELDPIERLQFFCALAMNEQDWLDVEPFFDDVTALSAPQKVLTAEEVTEPGHYWWRPPAGGNWDIVRVWASLPFATYRNEVRLYIVGGGEYLTGQFIGPIKFPEVQS
jgi:hypothetical protein